MLVVMVVLTVGQGSGWGRGHGHEPGNRNKKYCNISNITKLKTTIYTLEGVDASIDAEEENKNLPTMSILGATRSLPIL